MEGSLFPESIICWLFSAQYQMEPGSNHSTKESHCHPREGWFKGGRVGVRNISCNLIQNAGREGSELCHIVCPLSKDCSAGFHSAHFHVKENKQATHSNAPFDFITEKKCRIRRAEKVSTDHLHQSQYSRSGTRGLILC